MFTIVYNVITFLKTQGEIHIGQEKSITAVLKRLPIWDMSNFLPSSVFSRYFSTDKYFFYSEKYFILGIRFILMGWGNSSLSKVVACTRVTQGKACSDHHRFSNQCSRPAGFLQSSLGIESIMIRG